MPTVPIARSTETLKPITGQRQQVQRQDEGVSGGLQVLGQGLGQLARGVQTYEEKVNEATVNDLDSTFANSVRDIERSFTAAQGKNAVDIADATQKAWTETAASFLSRANNPAQAERLNAALDRRRARWSDQYDSHLTRQADVWQTEAFTGRVATMSVDVAGLPVDSPERATAMLSLGVVLDGEARRQGWDPAKRAEQGLVVFSSIHENTIKALVTSDPHAAEKYLNDHLPQIVPSQRPGLIEGVRSEVYAKDSFEDAHSVPDRSPATATTVETPAGSITLVRPVAATALSGAFGEQRATHTHGGADFRTVVRSPVAASADGVIRWRNDPDGYGRYAVIDHGGGLETLYAHLSGSNVPDGTRVTAGQTIGLSGGARGADGAGNSQGPHLHYEVRQNGQKVDPTQALAGGARSEGGSTVTTVTAAQPATLEDAYAEARRLAEARRPGDYRYAKAMEDAMVSRYGRTLSVQRDQEQRAQDAIAPYLPGGAQAAGSYADVPLAVRNSLSPTQDTQYRNVFRSAAEGEASVDPVEAGRTFQDLLDAAAGSAEQRAQFLAVDPYSYQGVLSNSQISQLRGEQRRVRAAKPEEQTQITSLLSGVSDVLNAYVKEAGIDTSTVEGAERKTALTQWLLDATNRMETPPDRNAMVGLLRLGLRQVSVDDARDNDPNTRIDLPAFEARGETREAMSREQREAAIASLARDYPNVRTFTPEQIAIRFRRQLYQGQ